MQKLRGKSCSIDSRTLMQNDAFFALKGKNFDGHNFVSEAIEKGASVAIVDNNYEGNELNLLRVNNPLETLQNLAMGHLKTTIAKRIAITGSNGKTTTKNLITSAVKSCIGEDYVISTSGNFNNHIGLPLTAMRVKKKHKIAIFEIGTNHIGEIAYLTNIIQPHVGLITMIGSSHLGNFSNMKSLANEKAQLFELLKFGKFLIVNADDPYCVSAAEKNYQSKKISFGYANWSDIKIISDIEPVIKYKDQIIKVKLNLPGKHNIKNMAAAFSIAVALNLNFEKTIFGFESVRPYAGRLKPEFLSNGIVILDDTYNASPESMEAGLDTLDMYGNLEKRRKIAILGDMRELGRFTKKKHFDVGVSCANKGVARLFTCGDYGKYYIQGALSGGISSKHLTSTADIETLIPKIISQLKSEDIVLVKGSRFAKLEILIDKIKNIYKRDP